MKQIILATTLVAVVASNASAGPIGDFFKKDIPNIVKSLHPSKTKIVKKETWNPKKNGFNHFITGGWCTDWITIKGECPL